MYDFYEKKGKKTRIFTFFIYFCPKVCTSSVRDIELKVLFERIYYHY